MKLRDFAAIGASAAALLFAGSASAAVFVLNFSGTTFTVTTISSTEFSFNIKNANAGWPNATVLGAFAFGDAWASGTTLTATGTGISSSVTGQDTGLNSGGCDNSNAAFVCFTLSPEVAVSSDMTYDIKATGPINFSSSNLPDLKIQFEDASDAKTGDLVSMNMPLCTTNCPVINPHGGVPEPATWAMMIIGAGMIGGVLRRRRKTALAIA